MNDRLMFLSHWMHLLGDNIEFENESLFTVNVGDKIKQIGVKSKSSSNRCMICNPYFTYVGSKEIEYNGDLQKCYFFQLPAGGVSGWDLFNPEVHVYLCVFKITDDELLIPCRNQSIWIMRPNFIYYNV